MAMSLEKRNNILTYKFTNLVNLNSQLEKAGDQLVELVFLKVDVDEAEDAAMKHNVTYVPKIILFNHEKLKQLIDKHIPFSEQPLEVKSNDHNGIVSTPKNGIHQCPNLAELNCQLEKAGGKLVAVEFSYHWCMKSKKIKPHITEMAHEYSTTTVFLGADLDVVEGADKVYRIVNIPTFIVFRKKTRVGCFLGSNHEKLKEFICKHLTLEEKS